MAKPMIPPAPAATRLPLSFKGERDYLHGSDMFNALVALTGGSTGILFQIHKVAHHPLDAFPLTTDASPEGLNAIFEYGAGEQRRCLGLREDLSATVESRKPYHEAAVTAGASISGNSVISPGPGIATFIERTIALNKVLSDAHFAPAKHKWWFVRLELETLPPAPQSLALTFISSIGPRLTKSAIEADGVRIGHIYFSRGAA